MKQYNSIPHLKECKIMGQNCYIFKKEDGSNLRFEWQRKKGFVKYGARRTMIDENHEVFGEAIQIFNDVLAKDVENRIIDYFGKKNQPELFTCYAEFLGENSFAGTHLSEDEKYLKLFDVELHKTGLLIS